MLSQTEHRMGGEDSSLFQTEIALYCLPKKESFHYHFPFPAFIGTLILTHSSASVSYKKNSKLKQKHHSPALNEQCTKDEILTDATS